jgi:hypothetical protein
MISSGFDSKLPDNYMRFVHFQQFGEASSGVEAVSLYSPLNNPASSAVRSTIRSTSMLSFTA